MANRLDLPFAVKIVQEAQWTKRTRKQSKIDFPKLAGPMGRGVVWCGDGLRRLLNRIFLRAGRIRLQSKADRAQEGTAWHSHQLSFMVMAETAWSPKWGKFTRKWPNSSQKGSLGALIYPNMVLNVEISKLSKFGR
jgi:hypothetical protein